MEGFFFSPRLLVVFIFKKVTSFQAQKILILMKSIKITYFLPLLFRYRYPKNSSSNPKSRSFSLNILLCCIVLVPTFSSLVHTELIWYEVAVLHSVQTQLLQHQGLRGTSFSSANVPGTPINSADQGSEKWLSR